MLLRWKCAVHKTCVDASVVMLVSVELCTPPVVRLPWCKLISITKEVACLAAVFCIRVFAKKVSKLDGCVIDS